MAKLTVSSTPRTPATCRIGAIGQSLAAYYWYQTASATFINRLVLAVTPATLTDGASIAAFALGGSYASQENNDADYAYEIITDPGAVQAETHTDDTGALADGSVLVGVVPRMATLAGVSETTMHLIWDQGQADAFTATGTSGVDPDVAAERYRAAWEDWAFSRYRLNTVSGDTSATKIGMQILGRSRSVNTDERLGYDRIRQQQLGMLASVAGAFKLCETYDIELADSVHPSDGGQEVLAKRAAEAFAKAVYSVTSYTDENGDTVTIYDGPSISSVTKLTDTTVQVVVTGNGESVSYPSGGDIPCGFRFGDAAEDYDQVFDPDSNPVPVQAPTGFSRSGNTLTFTLATPITGTVTMFFPYDTVPDFNPDLIIKGATSDKPLQSWLRP
jgi:hypothetical protein